MTGQIPGPDTYAVTTEPRRDYLRVVMSGVRSTVEASIEAWREIGRQVQAHGARRVLVVSKLSGPLPTPAQQLQILHALIGAGFEGVRTAFVLDDVVNVVALEFGEIIARELGQESRVFGSESVAELWLRHGEASSDYDR
ncbi:hypothetical protein [Tahibacter amnicola]|uniref:SpoIIAA-like protein n=1 Tax=Tahibacter amnicola TaxID=2976241 RepID=A0ABY6BEA5_9GAMM|nr:hypothetical protein [Tahibacter amnicola]UXI68130.1 hypothetical protein N4264_00310 [Tahibacter amnicola]